MRKSFPVTSGAAICLDIHERNTNQLSDGKPIATGEEEPSSNMSGVDELNSRIECWEKEGGAIPEISRLRVTPTVD